MPNFSKDNFTKWLHVAYIPECVMMFQMIILADDILSARYKLAKYYLREFTEISLYSQDTNKKVPLPKLYVAMKWMDLNEYASSGMKDSDEFAFGGKENCHNTKLTDYTEIFKMVFGYN